MGSGSKRKNNDIIRINVPKGSGGDTGGYSGGDDINRSCPIAFNVALQQDVATGAKVALSGADMIADGVIIGKLSSAAQKRISFCLEHGIQYAGRTERDKDEKSFVRFTQVP